MTIHHGCSEKSANNRDKSSMFEKKKGGKQKIQFFSAPAKNPSVFCTHPTQTPSRLSGKSTTRPRKSTWDEKKEKKQNQKIKDKTKRREKDLQVKKESTRTTTTSLFLNSPFLSK
jgi:hypothetical protein